MRKLWMKYFVFDMKCRYIVERIPNGRKKNERRRAHFVSNFIRALKIHFFLFLWERNSSAKFFFKHKKQRENYFHMYCWVIFFINFLLLNFFRSIKLAHYTLNSSMLISRKKLHLFLEFFKFFFSLFFYTFPNDTRIMYTTFFSLKFAFQSI